MSKYKTDFSQIPIRVVDTFDDPNDQLYTLTELTLSCINQHASLRRVKLYSSACTMGDRFKKLSLAIKERQSEVNS